MSTNKNSNSSKQRESKDALVRVAAAGIVGWIPGIGSALSQAAVESAEAFRKRRAIRQERQSGFVLDMAGKMGDISLEQLVNRLTASPLKETLAEQLLEAAGRTASQRKLIAIGRQLHRLGGIVGDETLNREVVEGATLSALEEPHVAVLDVLFHPGGSGGSGGAGETAGLTFSEIASERPDVERVLRPVLSMLQLHGLIAETSTGDADGERRWILSSYGRYFLRLFASAGEAAELDMHSTGIDG